MRVYLYRCAEGHEFEQQGGLDDALTHCACGQPARRRPFSGIPYLKGETVARSIPDPHYWHEAALKESRASGWDVDRAVRAMRSNIREDTTGNKFVEVK